jgi:hypothetical protein
MAMTRGVFIANQLCGVGEVVVRAVFPFPYLIFSNGGVKFTAVRMSDESMFYEPDEVGFVSGGVVVLRGYVFR